MRKKSFFECWKSDANKFIINFLLHLFINILKQVRDISEFFKVFNLNFIFVRFNIEI